MGKTPDLVPGKSCRDGRFAFIAHHHHHRFFLLQANATLCPPLLFLVSAADTRHALVYEDEDEKDK